MAESANTFETQNLLTARNVILVVVAVLVLSILWVCWSMLRPNDSAGMARDTYGIRGDGFRGLYEILEELHVPVRRDLAPPRANLQLPRTIALLGPDPELVLFEPKYLTALLSWVDGGGRLVVSPRLPKPLPKQHSRRDVPGERNILKLLEVDKSLSIDEQSATDETIQERSERDSSRPWGRSSSGRNRQASSGTWSAWANPQPTPRQLPVKATGSLSHLAGDVQTIAAPGDEFTALKPGDPQPAGAVSFKDEKGNKLLLAAVVPRGKGEIVVVSDPQLFGNLLIAQSDNSVLAAQALAPNGEPVEFDEYYHGLAVRGNAMFLLTRPGFATTAVAMLLVIGAVAWRSAVFLGPPLPNVGRSRRDIQEYIQSMGAFFARGSGHRRFLVREVRDGVLRQICDELHLPPQTVSADTIVTALARRHPQRAGKLRKVLNDVDAQLAADGEYPKSFFLPSVQRLAGCL